MGRVDKRMQREILLHAFEHINSLTVHSLTIHSNHASAASRLLQILRWMGRSSTQKAFHTWMIWMKQIHSQQSVGMLNERVAGAGLRLLGGVVAKWVRTSTRRAWVQWNGHVKKVQESRQGVVMRTIHLIHIARKKGTEVKWEAMSRWMKHTRRHQSTSVRATSMHHPVVVFQTLFM